MLVRLNASLLDVKTQVLQEVVLQILVGTTIPIGELRLTDFLFVRVRQRRKSNQLLSTSHSHYQHHQLQTVESDTVHTT